MSRRTRVAAPVAAAARSGSLMVTRYGAGETSGVGRDGAGDRARAGEPGRGGHQLGAGRMRQPLFVLRPFGCAVQVVDATGAHLGTYADVGRAIECGVGCARGGRGEAVTGFFMRGNPVDDGLKSNQVFQNRAPFPSVSPLKIIRIMGVAPLRGINTLDGDNAMISDLGGG